jgi:hypothetical protein
MIAAPTRTAVELLRFLPESPRTTAFFAALARTAEAADIDLVRTDRYRGDASWLVLWGPGGADRQAAMARQRAAGGHTIALDYAYWQRETKIRVSIDAPHPQAWVLRREWPATRLLADRVPVRDAWKPTGPVLLAGLGRKAREQYAADQTLIWEAAMIAACRARWPARSVLYRRKTPDAPMPSGVQVVGGGPIDQVLAGASLVVTWHSNVAVDAIRLGIPVVCRDGAAAAVCPADLPDEPCPLPADVRDRFLANLAWFQWGTTPAEAQGCWAFLRELLS